LNTTVNHSNDEEREKLTEVFFRRVQLPLALVVALLTKGANIVRHHIYAVTTNVTLLQLITDNNSTAPYLRIYITCLLEYHWKSTLLEGRNKFRQK